MTNLQNLPQLASGTTITIASNADWNDQFYVAQGGFAATSIEVTGNLTSGGSTISGVSTLSGVVPGMTVGAYGVPVGATVASAGVVSGGNTIALSQDATLTYSGAEVTLFSPPLDLTGITFNSEMRQSDTDPTVLLSMSTSSGGLMVNGGTAGTFGYQVPAASLPNWPAQLSSGGSLACVVDIEATDSSGAIVDLCVIAGPIPVTVILPVTRS